MIDLMQTLAIGLLAALNLYELRKYRDLAERAVIRRRMVG